MLNIPEFPPFAPYEAAGNGEPAPPEPTAIVYVVDDDTVMPVPVWNPPAPPPAP